MNTKGYSDGRVRLAIVGMGLIGRRHAEAISLSERAVLSAVVDPSETGRVDAEKFGAVHFADLDDMLSAHKPDGVIIATPTNLHVLQSMKCVKAGCPVLVEKPLATSVEDSIELVAEAKRLSVPILVGHHRRHNPLIQTAKACIEDGRIGAVRSVQATCWFYKPDGYFNEAPWRKQKGAGPISVNLAHDVDLIRHFCGEVVSVQAQSAPSLRGYENEDVASAILTFDSGAIASVSVSDSVVSPWSWELTSKENPVYAGTPESCYLIGGSEGALSIPDLRLWTHEGEPDWWSPISAMSVPCARTDPLVNQIDHFANVIVDGEAPLVSGQEGLRTLQVIEAIQNAAETGQTIHLNDPAIAA